MSGQRSETLIDVNDEEFLAALDVAFANLQVASTQRLTVIGTMIVNRAKMLCPVDTGRLRSAIGSSELVKDTLGAYIDVGVMGDLLARASGTRSVRGVVTNYGAYVEFGTRYMRAQPFMRPALAEASGGAFSSMAPGLAAASALGSALSGGGGD